ncbi:hypothetical protein [Aurantibacillus circumpalustris]|uniref:hypothetical protein n=1 Tax=Aurantibacillus circumpalustris TaxID=3036359 RepID=UPI00295C1964|nr:hypothetical protein [Aurantibacillus circumpalustris]
MKKSILIFSTLLAALFSKAQLNVNILNITQSNSITCVNDTIKLVVWSTYLNPVTYSWTGPANFSGALVKITLPGTYTVTATADSLSVSQVTVIGSNFNVPTSTISPLSQTISCTPGSAATVSASANPSLNITHSFLSPLGGPIFYSTGNYTPSAPGTYTHFVTDNSSGCKTHKTFTVSGGSGIPTGSLVGSNNFILGCNSKSLTVISLTNFITSPVSGGPLSYTILAPFGSTQIPTGSLSGVGTYSINSPGFYIVIVRDNNTLCDLRLPLSILQNINPPDIGALVPRQILDCKTPSVELIAFSSTSNTEFKWIAIGSPFPNVVIGNSLAASIYTANTTYTLINTYTLTVTNTNNVCMSSSIIPMYQNTYKPVAIIGTGGLNPCANENVVLTNLSTSGIPPNSIYPTNLPVNATAWSRYGVLLPPTSTSASTYQTSQQGVYTMTVTDLNNGCMSSTNTNVSSCVGLEENVNVEKNIRIYPNPGNGKFYLENEAKSGANMLEIYNARGDWFRRKE